MKFHFAVFMGHEMIFMGFSHEIHGIFIKLQFIVILGKSRKWEELEVGRVRSGKSWKWEELAVREFYKGKPKGFRHQLLKYFYKHLQDLGGGENKERQA